MVSEKNFHNKTKTLDSGIYNLSGKTDTVIRRYRTVMETTYPQGENHILKYHITVFVMQVNKNEAKKELCAYALKSFKNRMLSVVHNEQVVTIQVGVFCFQNNVDKLFRVNLNKMI